MFEAVVTTKLLYSCEAWLSDNLTQIENLYRSAIKSLLNVRRQTRNDVILVEGGFNNMKKIVNERKLNFMGKKLKCIDEPLTKIFNLCKDANTKGYRILSKANDNRITNTLENIKENINTDTSSTKLTTYKTINPQLAVHDVYYSKRNYYIPDYKRAIFTRF